MQEEENRRIANETSTDKENIQLEELAKLLVDKFLDETSNSYSHPNY